MSNGGYDGGFLLVLKYVCCGPHEIIEKSTPCKKKHSSHFVGVGEAPLVRGFPLP